jgi:hypothetical protein
MLLARRFFRNIPTIRPTETMGIAMGVVNFLTSMGLFIGQSKKFFAMLGGLAADADAARRGEDEQED